MVGMFIRAQRFSPSQKLVAVNFAARRFREIPARRPGDEDYVSVTMPVLSTARKHRKTVIYAGDVSLWCRRSAFPFGEHQFTVDDFAAHMDSRGSTHLSLDEDGYLLSIDPVQVDQALAMAEVLKEAFADLGKVPEGYDGWFVEA